MCEDIYKIWLLKPFGGAVQDQLLIYQPWFRLEIAGVSRGWAKRKLMAQRWTHRLLVDSELESRAHPPEAFLNGLPNKNFSFLVVLGIEPRVLYAGKVSTPEPYPSPS